MTESTAEQRPTCRHCGAPAPQWVSTCVCGQRIAPQLEPERTTGRWGDIALAAFLFLWANICLLAAGQFDVLSMPSMLARLIFLGVPLAAVLLKWYRLMQTHDPDYGQLWRTYWTMQITMFAIFVSAVVIFVVLSPFLFLLIFLLFPV